MTAWDFSAVVVGLPGFGKTTLLGAQIRRHLETTNGIVLAHDPVAQLSDHGCVFYENVDAWRAAARVAAAENKPMPRGASIGGDESDAITELALELGGKLNTAKQCNVPILVPYDEGSLREGSGSTHISKLDNRALAIRRHVCVGFIFNLQEAAQLTARFYRVSTDVFLFRQTEDRAYELDKLCFLDRGTLARAGVTRLEKHRYLHVRMGDGIVSDEL